MKIARDKAGAAPLGGISRAIGAIAVLLLFLGGAAPAAAQPVHLFQLEDISGTVEVGFRSDLENRSRSASKGSDFDRVDLSQLLHLNTHGYIYHPRFLTFDTGLRLEALEALSGDSGNRLLWGGDFRFNFLQHHRNSLSVYGSRFESEFARAFSETYSVTNDLYGVTFFQKWGWIPFDLSYHHATRSGGSNDQLDDSRDKIIFAGRYEIGERSDGKLDYDLAFEEIQGRDIRRQNLVASNESRLGDEGNKTLRTNVRFFEESDGRELRNANGRTVFDWKHTDRLRTQYIFNARWNESDDQTATNLDPRFLLTHQLYESLGTDFELFARLEDSSYRTRNEFGGRITENYLKRLDDWGRLNIRVSPHVLMTYNRLDEETAFVFDERHVLDGLQPVLLRQPYIIESSIVVTDANGSIVYDEGPLGDYIVNQIGGGIETELVRTPISNIADGQLVLVDYEFELVGDNDTLTTGVSVNTTLSFLDHWAVFGRYDTIDYHVLSGDKDELRLNGYNRYLAGVEFSGPWFAANAEIEDNDARITPSWGYSGSASVFTYGEESWSGRLNADYSYLNQGNSGPTVNRYFVSGVASKRFFELGLLEAEGGWLRGRWSGESSDANDIDALHFKLKYSWWYGKVEVKLETGVVNISRPIEDSTVFEFDLRVRRVF